MDVCCKLPPLHAHHSVPAPAGFTLIEVLITLFVLAVGLLGLAGLQIQGLRATHAALLRSQAVVLADEMAERLQAAPAGNLTDHDLLEWRARIAQALPAGDGSVAAADTPVTIAVRWQDHSEAQQFTLALTP